MRFTEVIRSLDHLDAGVRNITYDITELYAFIDNLGDLCCLVYNGSGAYEPHNKQVQAIIIHAVHFTID